jgi:hypothetical protein
VTDSLVPYCLPFPSILACPPMSYCVAFLSISATCPANLILIDLIILIILGKEYSYNAHFAGSLNLLSFDPSSAQLCWIREVVMLFAEFLVCSNSPTTYSVIRTWFIHFPEMSPPMHLISAHLMSFTVTEIFTSTPDARLIDR